MARGRFAFSDFGSVAFGADEACVAASLRELGFDAGRSRIRRSLVTRRTGNNRHINFQAALIISPRDIDMTGRAFQHVVFARVREFEREA